jgi:hypothetical protein
MKTTRRTTRAALDGMKRADHLRAQSASSSMHPSWLDDEVLAKGTLDWAMSRYEPFPRHWLDHPHVPSHVRQSVEIADGTDGELVRMAPGTALSMPLT